MRHAYRVACRQILPTPERETLNSCSRAISSITQELFVKRWRQELREAKAFRARPVPEDSPPGTVSFVVVGSERAADEAQQRFCIESAKLASLRIDASKSLFSDEDTKAYNVSVPTLTSLGSVSMQQALVAAVVEHSTRQTQSSQSNFFKSSWALQVALGFKILRRCALESRCWSRTQKSSPRRSLGNRGCRAHSSFTKPTRMR